MNFYKTVFCFLFILITALSYAQEPFCGGVSLGALVSQVDGDGYSGYDKSAIHGGIWVSREIGKNLNLMLEMTYKPKGSKSKIDATIENNDYYKMALHYVEVPLVLQYLHKKFHFDGAIGLAYCVYDTAEGIKDEGLTLSVGNKTGFNKFDIIGALGIGFDLSPKWSVTARFTYSLVDAAEKYMPPTPPYYSKQYNNVLSVSIYRQFNFGQN